MAIHNSINEIIREFSHRVYEQLSVGHTEKIYQEALASELRNAGWTVELERIVPISYTPQGFNHSVYIGTARLDIFATKNGYSAVVIELKAAASFTAPSLKAQIRVYLKALRRQYPDVLGIGVQFMQPGARELQLRNINDMVQFVLVLGDEQEQNSENNITLDL